MKIVTILNFKGGTAKSTTAWNMAHILATVCNKRVLACDLDSSGNLSAMLQVRPDPGDACGASAILLDKSVDPRECIVHTQVDGVDMLTGNDTLNTTETMIRMDAVSPQQFRLSKQLKKIGADYDYCIIDCAPTPSILVINALACAHEVIIPTHVGQDSFDAVVRVLQLADEVQDYNPGLSIRGILLTDIENNSFDKEGIQMDWGDIPRFRTYIRHSVEVERSRSANLCLADYAKGYRRKKFGPLMDYDNFVAEYLGFPLVHENVPYNPANVAVNV